MFDHLHNLKLVWMENNDCIDKNFEENFNEIAVIPKILNQECSACHSDEFNSCNLLYKLMSIENENSKKFKKLFEGIADEQKKLADKFDSLELKIDSLKANNEL